MGHFGAPSLKDSFDPQQLGHGAQQGHGLAGKTKSGSIEHHKRLSRGLNALVLGLSHLHLFLSH